MEMRCATATHEQLVSGGKLRHLLHSSELEKKNTFRTRGVLVSPYLRAGNRSSCVHVSESLMGVSEVDAAADVTAEVYVPLKLLYVLQEKVMGGQTAGGTGLRERDAMVGPAHASMVSRRL